MEDLQNSFILHNRNLPRILWSKFLLIDKNKQKFWFPYIETYRDAKRYNVTGLQALSGSRPLFMMTLVPSFCLPCPLIPIIWFRSVPPLYSLLSDSDGRFHNLVFPFWLTRNIKSLFPLHRKHYFWHAAGAQTCICRMHEFTALIGNQDRCIGHGLKELYAFLLSCVYFSPSEMECMKVC